MADTKFNQKFKFSGRSSTQNLDDLMGSVNKDNYTGYLDDDIRQEFGIKTDQEQLNEQLGIEPEQEDDESWMDQDAGSGKTYRELIDEYNKNGNLTQRKNYRKIVQDALNSDDLNERTVAKRLAPRLGKNAWENISDFTEESNKAFFGGTIKGGANLINWVGSGFNIDEADKRTKEFMKSAGLEDERGLSALESVGMTDAQKASEQRYNETDTASTAGRITGQGQKIALDAATMLIPAVSAAKVLQGIKALQGLSKMGTAGKVGASLVENVGGGAVATAIGGLQDPRSLTAENVGTNVGIDFAAGAAFPLLSTAFKAIRTAKNSKELAKLISEQGDNLTATAKQRLDDLAKQGTSGKQFRSQMDAIIREEESIEAVAKNIPDDFSKVDITDANVSQADKIKALANSNETLGGRSIEQTPLALRATSESADDIQRQLDDLYGGNFGDDMFDVRTADGAAVTQDDIARATERQTQLLENEKSQLMKQADSQSDVARENAQGRINEIDDQIAQLRAGQSDAIMQTLGEGTTRELNAGRVRDAIADLTARKGVAEQQAKADADFLAANTWKGSGRSSDEVGKELDDLRSGKLTDDVLSDSPNFQSLEDVETHIPELTPRIDALRQNIENVQNELKKFVTKQQGETAKLRVDREFDGLRQQLEGLSPERQKYELKGINEAHQARLAEIDADVVRDAPDVEKLENQLRQLTASQHDLILRANYIKNQVPGRFRVIDDAKLEAKQTELTKEKVDADTFPSPDDTSDVAVDALNKSESPRQFETKLDNDDAVKKSFDAKVDSARALNQHSANVGLNVLTTPMNVLRKFGQRGAAIADELLQSHGQFSAARGQFVDKANIWSRELRKEKGAADQVFKWLDGNDVKLSPRAQSVADEMRAYLDDKAKALGLTDETKIKNYIPHLFEQSFGHKYGELEKVVAKIRYGVDEAGKKLSKADIDALSKSISNVDAESLAFLRSNTSWRIKNGFLEQRTGAQGYSQDLFKVLSSYDNIANKKIYYEPALKFASAVSEGMDRDAVRYIETLSNKIRGDSSSIADRMFDHILGQGNTSKVLAAQRRLSNASVMGLSPLTWVKNLQDMSRTFADREVGALTKALPAAVKALKPYSDEYNLLFKTGIMESNNASFLKGMSLGNTLEKSTGAKAVAEDVLSKGENLLWSGMRVTDRFNRAVNFFASLDELEKATPGFKKIFAKGVDNPSVLDDAQRAIYDKGMEYLHKTNRETVFTFSDIDIPVHLNNAIGRSTINMQTYNLQNSKYILSLVKRGMTGSAKDRIRLAKFAAANAAFIGTIGMALGLKPQDLIPFGNEVAEGQLPQSPIVAQLMGNQYQKGLIPTSTNLVGALFGNGDLGKAAGEFGEAVGNTAKGYIPVQTQINRTVKGIESVVDGQARSGDWIGTATGNKGKVQFNQDQDTVNALMASIFGKSTTDAGKKWKAEGSRTLSPQQMMLEQDKDANVSIEDLSPEKRAMYTDFYNAVNNANPYDFDIEKTQRQTVSTKAKQAVKNGNGNKAFRLVKEYNDNLKERMREFVNQYGTDELPPAIIEQMQKQFIDYEDLVED